MTVGRTGRGHVFSSDRCDPVRAVFRGRAVALYKAQFAEQRHSWRGFGNFLGSSSDTLRLHFEETTLSLTLVREQFGVGECGIVMGNRQIAGAHVVAEAFHSQGVILGGQGAKSTNPDKPV